MKIISHRSPRRVGSERSKPKDGAIQRANTRPTDPDAAVPQSQRRLAKEKTDARDARYPKDLRAGCVELGPEGLQGVPSANDAADVPTLIAIAPTALCFNAAMIDRLQHTPIATRLRGTLDEV